MKSCSCPLLSFDRQRPLYNVTFELSRGDVVHPSMSLCVRIVIGL